jgi:hypothetical protein
MPLVSTATPIGSIHQSHASGVIAFQRDVEALILGASTVISEVQRFLD